MKTRYQPTRKKHAVVVDQILTGGNLLPGGSIQDIHEESSVQNYDIGTRLVMDDRVFRYCFAGGALHGMMAGHNGNGYVDANLAAETYEVGDQVITLLDTTPRDKNYYKGGYIWIMKLLPSEDYQFHRILSSPVSLGTSVAIVLEEPLRVTLAASTHFTAWRNIYSNITGLEDAKASQVAIALRDIQNGRYFWGQTWGPCFGTVHLTVPGADNNQRDLYFSSDGALMAATDHDLTAVQRQRAGFLLTQTTEGGDQFYMLQISP